MKKLRLLSLLVGLTAGFLALEIGFRLLEPRLEIDRQRIARFRELVASGGEIAAYEPRPHVLYARPRGAPGINRLGFGDDEHPVKKRAGVPRVACLGSSTTEGGNPQGREGSFPHFLKLLLEKSLTREVEVINFGMSGWTTAEMMVHYFLVVQDYSPDVVIIHEAANDVPARKWPRFEPDYSHYRRPWKDFRSSWAFRLLVRVSDAFAVVAARDAHAFGLDAVVVRPPAGPLTFSNGRFLPGTEGAYRRNLLTIAEHVAQHGGWPVLVTMPFDRQRADGFPDYHVGLREHNAILREVAADRGFGLLDLEAAAGKDAGQTRAFFLDLVHMTPEGNRWKAERMAELLAPRLNK